MHGLILVTWEKFLAERFGNSLLKAYRIAIGEEGLATSLLISRVYDDERLQKGVTIARQLTGISTDILLRGYGHYFITNSLTNHLCVYLLSQVRSGRDLLLTMRDAHTQMRRMPDGLMPPLFTYEMLPGYTNDFALIYDSPRHLCSWLCGTIEGATDRFGEKVNIVESTCMKRGASVCRFEIHYLAPLRRIPPQEPPELQIKQRMKLQLANIILVALPNRHGLTLLEIQAALQRMQTPSEQLRLSVILEALLSLQYTGLVTSTANRPGDHLTRRRYWRVPTSGPV